MVKRDVRNAAMWSGCALRPKAGHEQAGHRPALVLSPASYNRKTGLMLCCPITSQVKGYPFEVAVEGNASVSGVILADQVKDLDWRARQAKRKGRVLPEVTEHTLTRVRAPLV